MKTMLSLCLLVLCYTATVNAQVKEKAPFINGYLGTTFGVNQNHEFFDDGENGPLITPKSILLRTEFGYQLDQRWATSLNFGYDHHFTYAINSIPYFATLRYNAIVKSSSAYFTDVSFGRMWVPSNRFNAGSYYKFGVGMMNLSRNRWNGFFRIDFHRKKIAGFKNDNLDSISLGFGFTFL